MTGNKNDRKEVWGYLKPVPGRSNLPSLALTESKYSFGRHSKVCDFVFDERDFEDKILACISKVHFIIELNDENVPYVYDHSSFNGTFINKTKIVNSRILQDNDIIAMAFPFNAVFVYIDNLAIKDWLPKTLHTEQFSLMSLLGKGSYGEVRLARHNESDKFVAIKKVTKIEGMEEKEYREINVLKKLSFDLIVSMEDVFETPSHLYIVLEYVSGGNLCRKVCEEGILNDSEAKFIFYQLALALHYLHGQNVTHRDVKPENILLARYKEGDMVKLTDFGISKLKAVDQDDWDMRTHCGTPLFIAPEIIQTQYLGKYTHKVDVWSYGVTLHWCLSGTYPFTRTYGCLKEQIVRGSYSLMTEEWKNIRHEPKQLIQKIFRVEHANRIDVPDILNHPWFQDQNMKKRLTLMRRTALEGEPPLQDLPVIKQPRQGSARETIGKS